jgi:apolipoprotein N-acyltransferase
MIQPNVSQADAMSGAVGERTYERLRDFTRMYAKDRDLVVWPESALAGEPVRPQYGQLPPKDGMQPTSMSLHRAVRLREAAHRHGDLSSDGTSRTFRRCCFHGDYARTGRSITKCISFLLANTCRCAKYWPFSILRPLFPADFDVWTKTEPLKFKDNISIIPLICFEDTVGRVARRFVREEPQMIVAISNDGWFINSIETEMHLANAIFRAVELRTGPCCAVQTSA